MKHSERDTNLSMTDCLTLNQMKRITGGAMTREERDKSVEAKDDDSLPVTIGKDITRPLVKAIDAGEDVLNPINKKMESVFGPPIVSRQTVKIAWKTFTGWFR